MFSQNRNNPENWEDYDETPAGRAFLKMPGLWEEGTYPKKPQAPATVPVPEAPATPSVAFTPASPDPFKQAFSDPFKAGTAPSSGLDYAATIPESDPNDSIETFLDAFRQQRAFTEKRKANLQYRPQDSTMHDLAAMTPSVTSTPEVMATPLKTIEFSADQTPYRAIGQLMQKPGDTVRTEVARPIGRQIANAVQNKQPVNPAEQEMVENAGKMTNTVKQVVEDTYTRDNYIKAADALHQGKTEGNEMAYRHPASSADVLQAVHAGDTLHFGQTMGNANSTAHKGHEKSLREMRLSLQEVRIMGNRLIDPDGQYLDTKGLQQWIDSEREYIKRIRAPELVDFRNLDWKRDPDKFIALGGRYFRESLLGTHLFGYAVDAIKGPGGAGTNQFFGTVAGIARFYNRSDDMVGAILGGGALASADIGWDRYVNMLSNHLPGLSRQALLFANSVMSREMKAQMFERMTAEFHSKDAQRRADPSSS